MLRNFGEKIIGKNSKKFDENFEITSRERCKGVPNFRKWIPKAVQRSAMCRSRRELSNEYLLAKFGFDTADITIVNHLFVPLRYLQFLKIVRSTAAAAAENMLPTNQPTENRPLKVRQKLANVTVRKQASMSIGGTIPCDTCAPGTFAATEGADGCEPCAVGKFAAAGACF